MEATATLPAIYRLTYRDWLALPDKGGLCEIIEGELFMTPAPSTIHRRICGRIFAALLRVVEPDKGRVFFAPTGVKLTDDTVVEPDVLVVLSAHLDRIGEQVVEGPPDLAVETLLPGSVRRDLREKRSIYERFGVQEYWIADPVAGTVEVLTLRTGRLVQGGLFRPGDTLKSPLLPEISLPLAQIFEA